MPSKLSEFGPFEGVALRLSGIRRGEDDTGVGFEREKKPLEGEGREVSPGARRFLAAAVLDDISEIRSGSGCHMIGNRPKVAGPWETVRGEECVEGRDVGEGGCWSKGNLCTVADILDLRWPREPGPVQGSQIRLKVGGRRRDEVCLL